MAGIVCDDAVRSGDPHIEGTRVTVLDLKRRVIDNDEDPHVVAGEHDLSIGDLFRALAYYYDNRDRVRDREQEAEVTRSEGERRTRQLLEDVRGDDSNTAERAD
ncbi:DUF433 domain-containing protein [Halorarum halobium]|uniref:DUF433 domain-containing protein n=1 Tax=Halorarum halobium TaxID=3075121 RepID=UPI0028AF2CB1|nr:DUF433 domain-containing protein [Halobaculum sp. XH14]